MVAKRLTTTFLVLFQCLVITLKGQFAQCSWKYGLSASQVYSCADMFGNIFLAGIGYNYLAISNGDTIKPAMPGYFIFILKYDSSGNNMWQKTVPCTYTNIAGVGCDQSGNIYLSGETSDTSLIFGSVVFHSAIQLSTVFVVKYSSAGNPFWVNGPDAASASRVSSMYIDKQGNCYLAGNNSFALFSGSSGVFIWSCNAMGSTKNTCRVFSEYCSNCNQNWDNPPFYGVYGGAVVADSTGNVTFTGTLEDGDSIILGDSVFYKPAKFIVYLDSTGSVKWARTLSDYVNENSLYCINDGNIYMPGKGMISNSYNSTKALYAYDIWGSIREVISFYDSVGISPNPVNNLFIYNPASTVTSNAVAVYKMRMGAVDTLLFNFNTNVAGGFSFTDNNGSFYYTGTIKQGVANTALLCNEPLAGLYAFWFARISVSPVPSGASGLINVFPNPSTGLFYIDGVKAGNTLVVFNVIGEEVFIANMATNYYQLDISDKQPGLYLLRVLDKGTIIQQSRLIKE